MRKYFFLLAMALSVSAVAQHVGVGTTTPAARLHVVDSLTDVRLLIESTPGGSEARLSLLAGNNPFSFLQLSKYGQGALGSLAGIPKDNLSAISTGGNAGPLLLNTGDGVSPLIFGAGTGERMRITAGGRVGIGTAVPATANNLHLHSNAPASGNDVSIGITNSATTDASLRGARLRMYNEDFYLSNYEATGKMSFSTNFNERLVIMPSGKTGINTPAPAAMLHVTGNGTENTVLRAGVPFGQTDTRALFITNPNNSTLSGTPSIGVHAVVGDGTSSFFFPTDTYGLIGECRSTVSGFGVLGISYAPSANLTQAAVRGINFSADGPSYGVMGSAGGSSGAGTIGYTGNATAGLLGYAHFTSTGPAIKSTSLDGSARIGLELENGAIKVSGSSRTAFLHTATAGNTSLNETVIPATTFANNVNDMLFVTPVWEGIYVNAPIGVYFSGGTWRIFRQDLQAMPLNAKFNVLVIKQ